MTVAADPACLDFPLTAYPGFNRFVLDWLAGDARFLPPRVAQTFSPRPKTQAESLRHTAVGPLSIPEELITELLALYNTPRPSWLRSGITFRDSFAELLATLAPTGVVFVDAMLPELRRAGAPLFESIGSKWDAMQRALH